MSGNRNKGIAPGPIRSFWRRPARRGRGAAFWNSAAAWGSPRSASRTGRGSVADRGRAAGRLRGAGPAQRGEAGLKLEVVEADIARLPAEPAADVLRPRDRQPALFPRRCGHGRAGHPGKEASFREDTDLRTGSRSRARLRRRGWLTMIQLADRLPDMLAALDGFGSVGDAPAIAGRARCGPGPSAARARAGGRRSSCLRPLLLHEGAAHLRRRGKLHARGERGPARRGGAALARSRDRSQLKYPIHRMA
jgi:hypothetical protein